MPRHVFLILATEKTISNKWQSSHVVANVANFQLIWRPPPMPRFGSFHANQFTFIGFLLKIQIIDLISLDFFFFEIKKFAPLIFVAINMAPLVARGRGRIWKGIRESPSKWKMRFTFYTRIKNGALKKATDRSLSSSIRGFCVERKITWETLDSVVITCNIIKYQTSSSTSCIYTKAAVMENNEIYQLWCVVK